jgi:hypothetical protein
MSLFDLPPEIRNRIYHHLFKGIVVPAIVATSSSIGPDVWRDRTMGLNMLLASKKCLSEAKPILFAGATFYFDLGDCGRTPGHMKTSLSPNDLYQVRRIKYLVGCTCSLPCGRCFLCAEWFTKTPQLSGIEITNNENETPIDARDVVEINKEQLLRIFQELFEFWPEDDESCLHKDVFQYIRQKASGGQAAELVLKFSADFKDGLGVMTILPDLSNHANLLTVHLRGDPVSDSLGGGNGYKWCGDQVCSARICFNLRTRRFVGLVLFHDRWRLSANNQNRSMMAGPNLEWRRHPSGRRRQVLREAW